MKVDFFLLKAGYCKADLKFALHKSKSEIINFCATVGLIIHPTKGLILFDTGYTTDFYKATKKFPNKIYAKTTEVFIEKQEEISAQLTQFNFTKEDVNYIIISHFHADHICGLNQFTNATFICNSVAYDDIKNRKGFFAVKKAFLPELLPKDFEKRTQFIDFKNATLTDEYLGKTIDIFGDNSIKICDLPGHAKGQIGALINAKEQEIFLVADAAWLKPNYQKLHLPSPMIKIFIDSWTDYKSSIFKIHNYHTNNPKTKIIPCHCEETFQEVKKL